MRIVLLFAIGAALLSVRDAGACSCVGPDVQLISPDRTDDVPLNTRIRIDAPPQGSGPKSPQITLRIHGSTAAVASTVTTIPNDNGSVATLEITPSKPLAPRTRYEVASVDPTQTPAVTVFGTFKTGDAADTIAPKLETLGVVTAHKRTNAAGSMCQAAGPWVTIDGIVASDPGRASAELGLAIWLPDGAGKIDDTKPPTSIEPIRNGRVQLGRSSICAFRSFPLPATGQPSLGIALVDEAGNKSATKRVRVDLTAAGP